MASLASESVSTVPPHLFPVSSLLRLQYLKHLLYEPCWKLNAPAYLYLSPEWLRANDARLHPSLPDDALQSYQVGRKTLVVHPYMVPLVRPVGKQHTEPLLRVFAPSISRCPTPREPSLGCSRGS
jgi:hypothetical protein